ncbi:hypothetical protein, partial [Candidatus Viridilinea mediisalina]
TREALAHALRSIFDARLTMPVLRKLLVIFSGGVELYDLIVSEASSLHSVCVDHHLIDLGQDEAVALIADGLVAAGLDVALATGMGHVVYSRVAGHPYLTQRLGALLLDAYQQGQPLNAEAVVAAEVRVRQGDTLLRRIHSDLRKSDLLDAARRLISDPPIFTRLDDDMARLELIGLAKQTGDRWAARNLLLAEVFGGWLGVAVQSVESPDRAESLPTEQNIAATATPTPPASRRSSLASHRPRSRRASPRWPPPAARRSPFASSHPSSTSPPAPS